MYNAIPAEWMDLSCIQFFDPQIARIKVYLCVWQCVLSEITINYNQYNNLIWFSWLNVTSGAPSQTYTNDTQIHDYRLHMSI